MLGAVVLGVVGGVVVVVTATTAPAGRVSFEPGRITLFTVILLALSNADSFTPCFEAILLSESLRFTTYTAPEGAAVGAVAFGAGVFAAGVFAGAFAAGAVAFAGTSSVSPG